MTDARVGRGAANGGNANWFNSPLWDNIEAKKKQQGEVKPDIKPEVVSSMDELDLRARQRKAFSLAY